MEYEIKSTAPKPFVFVLMPFDEKFDDIYKFGIKEAAKEEGAYAERIDEQIFLEGILERIFNQINKADIIVADMTGRNENVFYEVGYAHALGKIVLLLTQNVDDIPFDLKNKQHIVYAGKIETLQSELKKKIRWAISESSRKRKQNLLEKLLVSLPEVEIPEEISSNNVPVIVIDDTNLEDYLIMHEGDKLKLGLTFSIRNHSPESIFISYIYLLTSSGFVATTNKLKYDFYNLPSAIDNFKSLDGLSKQFILSHTIPPLEPEAVDQLKVEIGFFEKGKIDELFKLRIHTSSGGFYDFPFRIKYEY